LILPLSSSNTPVHGSFTFLSPARVRSTRSAITTFPELISVRISQSVSVQLEEKPWIRRRTFSLPFTGFVGMLW